MSTHNFDQKLQASLGERELFDIKLLKRTIPGCVDVQKTSVEIDKTGIDYIATLREGAKVTIDAKSRDSGCSKYWRYGEPELVLERWSQIPDAMQEGKIGWTLNENNNVDLILYTYPPEDSEMFYLVPFQPLRMAFSRNLHEWEQMYPLKEQNSDKKDGSKWKSLAMFVPASVVLKAVNSAMIYKMV